MIQIEFGTYDRIPAPFERGKHSDTKSLDVESRLPYRCLYYKCDVHCFEMELVTASNTQHITEFIRQDWCTRFECLWLGGCLLHVTRVLVPVLRQEGRRLCDPSCQRATSWFVCLGFWLCALVLRLFVDVTVVGVWYSCCCWR